MYIDYSIISYDTKDSTIKQNLKELLDISIIQSVTAPYHFVKSLSSYLPSNIKLSCFIDYPLGISNIGARVEACKEAIRSGADSLDISMPQVLVANRKYDKIREDLKLIQEISKDVEIRYILEYRHFDHNCLKKICEILDSFEIKFALPSSGFFLDNISDNILASIFLYKNSKDINIILSGNAWKDEDFEMIKKSGLFGFRSNSIFAIKNYYSYTLKHNGV